MAAATGVESQEANVCVAVRCRPVSGSEAATANAAPVVSFPGGQRLLLRGTDGQEHQFAFDHVLPPECSQEQVFGQLGEPLLDRAFAGFHGTIFAYGQTGSGKTHTMLAHRVPPPDRGLIPRLADALFARIAELEAQHKSRCFLVCCSFLEIYNEAIIDLLVPRARQPKAGLEVKEQRGVGVYVKDLSEMVVETPERLAQIIDCGFEHRATAATKMNQASSRSHCVFTVKLHQKDSEDPSKNSFSRLNLVDLAGSERAKATEADGQRLKEGANINKSLSALGNVINALSSNARSSKKVFVPYRNSKLTRVLQDSLGGNSLCTMVATIGPCAGNADETLSTLNYAKRAKVIRVMAVKNEEEVQVKQLDQEVQALMRKLDEVKAAPRPPALQNADEINALESRVATAAAAHVQQELSAAQMAAGVATPFQGELSRRQSVVSELGEEWQGAVPGPDLEDEEAKYKARILELQALMEQSWEEKQRLTKQREDEQRAAQLEAQRAAEQVVVERHRRLKLLEQSSDIQAVLQALNSCSGGTAAYTACCLSRVPEVLGLERQLSSQLHSVKLYRESAAADLQACMSRGLQDIAATLTLLRQVQGKLSSMTEELMALGKLEVQLQEELGRVGPELALARQLASEQSVNDEAHDELQPRDLLALLESQLARRHARILTFVDAELQQLALSSESQWLAEQLRQGIADAGVAAPEGRAELLEALQARAAAVEASVEGEGEASVGPPRVLGLAAGDLPEGCLSASSNEGAASCARLLCSGSFGGWCPREDSPEEFLEVDMQEESLVMGISVQGRQACCGEPAQTRDLLQLVLVGSTIEMPSDEKSFARPPVRLVHNVGMLMAHVWGCFGSDWQIPEEFFNFPTLSREQKFAFFAQLISHAEIAHSAGQFGCVSRLALTPEDILHGRNSTEVNRLLQMLALLGLRRAPGAASRCGSGGLLDPSPQWTSKWRLRLLCKRRGWLWWNYSAADGACASDSDDEDAPASESGAHLFAGSCDASSVQFQAVPHPVWASRLRIYPAEWHRHAALRCEVHVARPAAESGPVAPAVARGRRSRDLEGWALLACKCALALQVDLEALQLRSHKAEAEVAHEEGAQREREKDERDALLQQLEDIRCRSEELVCQRDAFERQAAEAKTLWVQAHVDCQIMGKEAERLEASLATVSESRRQAQEEREALLEDRDVLQGSVDELLAQVEVLRGERDHSRAEEERLFGLLASKEMELEDTSNGYVRLTERLQEKEEELRPVKLQVAALERQRAMFGKRLAASLEEELELRLEQQRLNALLANVEQGAAALRVRSKELAAGEVPFSTGSSWNSSPTLTASADGWAALQRQKMASTAPISKRYEADFDESRPSSPVNKMAATMPASSAGQLLERPRVVSTGAYPKGLSKPGRYDADFDE